MKKAVTSAVVLVGVWIFVTLVGIAGFINLSSFSASHGMILKGENNILGANMNFQGIKQSFEKTALFFGIMQASKELGAHGGLSESDAKKASTLSPKMESTDDIPYWAVARCKTVGTSEGEIKKRVPFVFYDDYNVNIGTAETMFLLVDAAKYKQNLDDVMASGYNFHALVHIFMLKPGTVTVKACQAGICSNAETTDKDGFVKLSFGSDVVKNNAWDINLAVSGTEKDIAVVRQVAVSIYDKDIVESANKLLESKVNTYQDKLTSFSKEGINYKVGDLKTAFVPSLKGVYGGLDEKEGFVRGIAWSPEKLTAESKEVALSSWGVSEEDVKIRYLRMYKFAEYFVDNLGGLVKASLKKRLDSDFLDYSKTTESGCGFINCPSDTTPSYTQDQFLMSFKQGLQDISSNMNTVYGGEGFKWNLSAPDNLFKGCATATNPHKSPNSGLDSCSSENFEHIESKDIFRLSTNPCDCTSGDVCGVKKCKRETFCNSKYAHRYILKNIKILVKITDEKYKTFDSTNDEWKNPEFNFFIELDKVDDNYCDGNYCDTLASGASLPVPTVPSIPL